MSEVEPIETIHLYIVREDEAQQETPFVDSTAQDTAKTGIQPLVKQSQPTRGHLFPYLIITAHLLIVLFALSAHQQAANRSNEKHFRSAAKDRRT